VYRKERAVAVATIGRAIRNWREAAMVRRRETAAELIGRVIRNWRETILSIAPCWKENWNPYCRPWLSLKKSLRAISNAELGAEIVTEMNMCRMILSWNHIPEGIWRMHEGDLRTFWRAHPTVQHPETYLCRDFEQLLQDWGLEWFQECFGDTRWRKWVAEWNDNRDDGIGKQIMTEAIFVGDEAQGVGAVAIYANRQLEQWMEQWQLEAEIIAENQKLKLNQRQETELALRRGDGNCSLPVLRHSQTVHNCNIILLVSVVFPPSIWNIFPMSLAIHSTMILPIMVPSQGLTIAPSRTGVLDLVSPSEPLQ
jgi:hypothetical protein